MLSSHKAFDLSKRRLFFSSAFFSMTYDRWFRVHRQISVVRCTWKIAGTISIGCGYYIISVRISMKNSFETLHANIAFLGTSRLMWFLPIQLNTVCAVVQYPNRNHSWTITVKKYSMDICILIWKCESVHFVPVRVAIHFSSLISFVLEICNVNGISNYYFIYTSCIMHHFHYSSCIMHASEVGRQVFLDCKLSPRLSFNFSQWSEKIGICRHYMGSSRVAYAMKDVIALFTINRLAILLHFFFHIIAFHCQFSPFLAYISNTNTD